MSTVHASVTTSLPPDDVLRILTDFGPGRADAWPGVDEEHLTLHDQGEGWADVTEGDDFTWERELYTWDAAAGTIAAVTTESNVWAAGSRWDYRLTPQDDGGTTVHVTLQRHGKTAKGKLIALLLPLVGKSRIEKSLTEAFKD